MNSLEDYKREALIQRKSREVAEMQLEEKSRELFEKNQTLHAALRQVNSQQQKLIAQEKSASIGQLSAGLAHEINNPNAFVLSNIGTLNGYVENLVRGLDAVSELLQASDGTPDNIKQNFTNITEKFDIAYIKQDVAGLIKETEQGSLRIKRIIKGLEYFSSQNPRQVKIFDLLQCIQKTIALLESESGIVVDFVSDFCELPSYQGVPTLFSQALMNILRNAAESHSDSNMVHVSASIIDNEIVVCVKDDGDGISEDHLQRVFDPFYTTKPYVSGLGLTISQAIVKQHGGYIGISSKINRGTIFEIHLPKERG